MRKKKKKKERKDSIARKIFFKGARSLKVFPWVKEGERGGSKDHTISSRSSKTRVTSDTSSKGAGNR